MLDLAGIHAVLEFVCVCVFIPWTSIMWNGCLLQQIKGLDLMMN